MAFTQTNPLVVDNVNNRVGIGCTPTSPLTVAGVIENTSGGIKYSDATTQTTAAGVGTNTRFTHIADVGSANTTETDIYSDTTAASTLAANGAILFARYAGTFVNSSSTKQLRVYFGGTAIFDSGALTITGTSDWDASVMIIRESSSVVRCTVSMNSEGASLAGDANYTRITGLTLSGTNILKVTGQSAGIGSADNDIVGSMGAVWQP